MTRTGRLEASHLGVQMSYRYQNLKLPKNVWTSTAERTVVSAKSFVRGIEEEEDQIKVVEIYEGAESGADSLTPYKACPAYSGSIGSDQSSEYVKKYTKPIIARLHAQGCASATAKATRTRQSARNRCFRSAGPRTGAPISGPPSTSRRRTPSGAA